MPLKGGEGLQVENLSQESFRSQQATFPGDCSMSSQSPLPTHDHATKQSPLQDRMRDLRLLHHYLVYTCVTLDLDRGLANVWKHSVVDESLKHEFMMDGVLALASFHSAHMEKRMVISHISHALQYQNRALAGFRHEAAAPNPCNANALFLFTIITMVCALIPTNAATADEAQKTSERLLAVFPLIQGIQSVMSLCGEWISNGTLKPFFQNKHDHNQCPGHIDSRVRHALRELRAIGGDTSSTNHDAIAICRPQLEWLEHAFERGKGMAIGWFGLVPREYIDLVQNGEPLALLVFMLWGVLLDRLRNEWWAGQTGLRLIEEIGQILERSSSPWKEAVQTVKACLPGNEPSNLTRSQ